jgi:hypothetical protein
VACVHRPTSSRRLGSWSLGWPAGCWSDRRECSARAGAGGARSVPAINFALGIHGGSIPAAEPRPGTLPPTYPARSCCDRPGVASTRSDVVGPDAGPASMGIEDGDACQAQPAGSSSAGSSSAGSCAVQPRNIAVLVGSSGGGLQRVRCANPGWAVGSGGLGGWSEDLHRAVVLARA